MATTVLQEAKPLTQVIYNNVKEVVEQGQYIFDTLWNAAIPAGKKVREIEEGKINYETKLIENNPDGKGATFSFTLPRVSNNKN